MTIFPPKLGKIRLYSFIKCQPQDRQVHNIADYFLGMSQEGRPTHGVDTLASQRVPQKILKKSISLYYTAAPGLIPAENPQTTLLIQLGETQSYCKHIVINGQFSSTYGTSLDMPSLLLGIRRSCWLVSSPAFL